MFSRQNRINSSNKMFDNCSVTSTTSSIKNVKCPQTLCLRAFLFGALSKRTKSRQVQVRDSVFQRACKANFITLQNWMMVNNALGLLYLKKTKQYQKGPLPIYLRPTVNGKRSEVATKRRREDPGKWCVAADTVTGSKEATKIVNAHLALLQSQVYEAYINLLQDGKVITTEAIKNKLQEISASQKDPENFPLSQ